MVSGDPKWNILTANVADSLQQATQKTAGDLDSDNPDLSKFHARGSKLILYHGWNDPAISPWNTIAYYQSVQKAMGDTETTICAALHGARHGTLCGWPRSVRIRAAGNRHHQRTEVRGIRCPGRLGRKECSPAAGDRHKIRRRQEGRVTRPLCPYPELPSTRAPAIRTMRQTLPAPNHEARPN